MNPLSRIENRYAAKKAVGSSRNGRDSKPKYRGVKKYEGEFVKPGSIIMRQVGNKLHPGANVGQGKDFTLYSLVYGHVRFTDGKARKNRKYVHVDLLPYNQELLMALNPNYKFIPDRTNY